MKPGEFFELMSDGRYRFRVDHHTINDFNTCDQYFAFRHMTDATGKVWGTKGRSFKVEVGSWWSSVMEAYYNEMSHNSMPTDHHVFKFATDSWSAHQLDAFQTTDPELYDKFGGIDGARLMALEYHQAFGAQHFKDWVVLGPELGFGWRDELKLGEDDEVVVYYGGKPDLTIYHRAQRMIMPLDFKTKDSVPSNANVLWKPHPQTAGYIFAIRKLLAEVKEAQTTPTLNDVLEPTKCIVMVCARLRPTDKPKSGIRAPRFLPCYPNYTADEIEEWRLGIMEKCRRLRTAIKRGVWIKRESACHLYYHGCAFRRVCSAPAATRDLLLKADFIKQDPWVPYSTED